ncbi:hypothetical protein CSUNSWCD_494 [Campylobacter showae CSUNSWCD]|uniref:Uncharacterized protein n=1 Tax=Campylobacter showae CSUNSWCD TaxID=1244083 RepID=M5IQQ3_9BACT|nr:hypothetical protein CSUNSWCD_494 [Campylobacter showae CSUNSWCD]
MRYKNLQRSFSLKVGINTKITILSMFLKITSVEIKNKHI